MREAEDMTKFAQIGAAFLIGIALVFGVLPIAQATIISTPTSIDFGNVPINTLVTDPIDITVDAGYTVFGASGGLAPPFGFSFDTCVNGGSAFAGPGICTVEE